MLVRRETPDDVAAIRAVTIAAFVRPGRPRAEVAEARLVDELRACDAWLSALSLVAVEPTGAVVGHVVCSRGRVGAAPVLALGPLSVCPAWQRHGVGSALMHAVLGAAEALDEPLVALLGEPAFYARFGFRRADELGIQPPNPKWGRYFQARPLTRNGTWPHGKFAYPPPFDDV